MKAETMLKLDRLPERTPVKLAIQISPALHAELQDYAAIYAQAYGKDETVANLIPFMLEAFIAGDTGFKKAKRTLNGGNVLSSKPAGGN